MTIKKQPYTLYLGPAVAAGKKKTRGKKKVASFGAARVPAKGSSFGIGVLPPRKATARKKAAAPKTREGAAPRRVGVWDIDVHAGFLYRVFDRINTRQDLFHFHPVEVTAPVGLTITGSRTRELVRKHGLDPDDPNIADNTLASDIFPVATPIRAKLGLDVLVAVISPMIMDLEVKPGDEEIGWNYFSTSFKGVVIASAYGLRAYAKKAKRPFEACLATIIVTQVLQDTYKRLDYHEKTRGCVFDYCDNRDDIVKGLKTIHVCDASLALIPEQARADVKKIFDAIREYPA